MDKKGIFIEIPSEDDESLVELSKDGHKISKVSIIRKLLRAIRGMGRDCSLIVFDKQKMRIIQGFDELIEVDQEYLNYSIHIKYSDGCVISEGAYTRRFGGDNQ